MNVAPVSVLSTDLHGGATDLKSVQEEKVPEQFESILLRQFLSESMKPLLQEGPASQVYGYLLTDSLASSIAGAGGLGLSSVLQAQLGTEKTDAK